MKLAITKFSLFVFVLLSFTSCKHIMQLFSDNKDDDTSGLEFNSLETPQNFKATNVTYLGADLSWDKVPNAHDYYIKMGSTNVVSENTSCRIKNEIPGQTQTITIVARNSSNKTSEAASISVSFPESKVSDSLYPYPKDFKFVTCTHNSISLNWSSVSKAAAYYIYMSTDGKKYELVTSYYNPGITICALKASTQYYFKIATLFSNGTISQYSPVVTATTNEYSSGGTTKTGGGDSKTGGETTKKTTTVNYTGAKCYLQIYNDARDSGHYIYKIVIQDTKNKNYTILSKSNLKIKSIKDSVLYYDDFTFCTNETLTKNDLKVTVYAKGGKKGYGSGVEYITPSSTSISRIRLYWDGDILYR